MEINTCVKIPNKLLLSKLPVVCPDSNVFCPKIGSLCAEDCNGHVVCLISVTCWCDSLFGVPTFSEKIESDLVIKFCSLQTKNYSPVSI